MASYHVLLHVDGSRLPTIEKEAQKAFGSALRSVKKVDLAKSRADRLAAIKETIESEVTELEELIQELQDWYDNMPEGIQGSDKGSELEEAIQNLEELKDSVEGLDFDNVSFPAMM